MYKQHINVITISHQYGSDGDKIAAKLAFKLHWQYVDREIMMLTAYLLGLTEEETTAYDMHTYSLFERILLSLQFASPEATEAWASQHTMPISPQKQERLYHEALRQVVEATASIGNVVIVGHGAQLLLANQPHVFHVQIATPFPQRVVTVMQRKQLDEAQARASIQHKDRDVARYLRSQYHCDVNDPLLYDLMVNSSTLDLDSLVDLICSSLERKTCSFAVA